ncbi:GspMb/PilO family protein [Undibacterium amnicola]|uniref:GspMb/PilO family protein n=1 Tax=Undibacterium amnicola TaxID=1834038 RepID=UPI001C9B65B7|nr:GspMb/PilO family protein [Undibacterium amnicola]
MSLLTAGLLMLCVCLAGIYSKLWMDRDLPKQQLREAIAKFEQVKSDRKQAEALARPLIQLPAFDSARLVQTLNAVASDMQVGLEEVSYVLDDNANQAYLRYRISFGVLSRYPVLKKMIGHLQEQSPHILLDGISCSREDIISVDLHCELVLSAYFSKA